MRNCKVYVAGPIRRGQVATNLQRAILAADELWRDGFTPYVSHAHYIWEIMCPHPDAEWLRLDLEWLAECDALLRLPGDSEGADIEEAFAKSHGIPVFYGMAGLRLWAGGERE